MSKHLPTKPNKKSNLALLRNEKQLTQIQLANELGLTVKTYRDYELGKQLPKTDMLIVIADYFNVSTDYILGRSNCRGVDNAYISNELGLNDNAINVLRKWNKYQNDMDNGFEKDITVGDKIAHIKSGKQNLIYRPLLILNTLLNMKYYAFEKLLRAIQNLLYSDYTIPVYHTDKGEVVYINEDYPQTLVNKAVPFTSDMDVIKGGGTFQDMYLLTLARDTNTTWDNIQIPLTNDFFEGVALKQIDKAIQDIHAQFKDSK